MFHKAFSKVNLVLKIFKKDIDHKKHKVDAVTMIYKKIYDKIKINKSKITFLWTKYCNSN